MKIPKAGKSMAPKPDKKPPDDIHSRKLAVETGYLDTVKATIVSKMDAAGITKAKLAHRVGITEETLQRTIFAANANPTVQQVGRVAAALGLTPTFGLVDSPTGES